MNDRWLSVDEVSEHLGVKRDTVYKWINDKGLPAHKIGRLWKFKVFKLIPGSKQEPRKKLT